MGTLENDPQVFFEFDPVVQGDGTGDPYTFTLQEKLNDLDPPTPIDLTNAIIKIDFRFSQDYNLKKSLVSGTEFEIIDAPNGVFRVNEFRADFPLDGK